MPRSSMWTCFTRLHSIHRLGMEPPYQWRVLLVGSSTPILCNSLALVSYEAFQARVLEETGLWFGVRDVDAGRVTWAEVVLARFPYDAPSKHTHTNESTRTKGSTRNETQ